MIKQFDLCGEIYYKVEDIQEFIKQCTIQNKIIWCIEFVKIINKSVIPYAALQSIDSADLYNAQYSYKTNVSICNEFIQLCVDKCSDKLKDLYFCATVDD